MTLHVDITGQGPDLVLLHGWGLHSGAWTEVLPALATMARVHAIDLPGHGHSAGVAARTFDEATDAVAAVVPKGAMVCGWSLGGLIAQNLAHRHPDRVARLALVATNACFVERPGWRNGMKLNALESFAAALAADRDGMLKRFVALNAMHAPHGRDAVRAFTERLLDRGVPSDAALAASLAWMRDVDLREQTVKLRVPAVVMHGRRDMIAPVGAGRWLAQHLELVRFTELPEAAHMPFFSHRGAFVALLGELVG
jgi:pimeloyl-[acyl-carrier protein] methyl ester esterase